MNKQRKKVIENNEVSLIKTYTLGGYEQKVLLDGKSKNNPILLFLHGVGMPIPFSVGCRGMFPEFTEHFIMVYWDQLGCGINNHIIDDSFSVNKFTDMTVDLLKHLKREYPDNQIIVFGVSWGSVLAAKTVEKVPELVDNVLVYGQIIRNMFFNEEVYDILWKAEMPRKARERLTVIQEKKEFTPNDIKELASLIRKYTEGYQSKSGKKAPMGKIIWGLLTSPDYSFKNFIAIVKNGFMNNQNLWNELVQIDLSELLENISVPYRILQGDKDIVTSTKTVSDFVAQGKNPDISFKIINNNGHMPNAAAMDEVLAESIKLIK